MATGQDQRLVEGEISVSESNNTINVGSWKNWHWKIVLKVRTDTGFSYPGTGAALLTQSPEG